MGEHLDFKSSTSQVGNTQQVFPITINPPLRNITQVIQQAPLSSNKSNPSHSPPKDRPTPSSSIRHANIATITSPTLIQAKNTTSLKVLNARISNRWRSFALAAFFAVEGCQHSLFLATESIRNHGIRSIDLLVQITRSPRALFDRAGGLDCVVELGRDGVCEKKKRVSLSGYSLDDHRCH